MYKILKAEKLSENIFLMDVHAPRVASHDRGSGSRSFYCEDV